MAQPTRHNSPGDKDTYLRSGVAANPNTPPELLAKLAGDKDHSVGLRVMENPSTLLEDL